MHINVQTFEALRQKRGWTQAELARRSRVAPKTIGRIKNGEELRRINAERIAQAFGVSVEVLQHPPNEELINQAAKKWGTERLVLDLNGSILNDLWLVSRRYNVSIQSVVQFAPLLFSVVAERSLLRRQKELDEWLERFETLAVAHPANGEIALDLRLLKDGEYDIYETAKDSIVARDLSAGVRDVYSTETSAITPHPFFETIEEIASELELNFIESTLDDLSFFHDAHSRAVEDIVPDGYGSYSIAARAAIGIGYVLLRDMPDELMAVDRTEDRVKWLASFYGGANGDLDAALRLLELGTDIEAEAEADERSAEEGEDA